jgi:superfamily II DNA/RNA helicase
MTQATGGAGAPSGAAAKPTSKPVIEYKSFDDMELPEDLLRGVYAAGFERPSEIQTKAIGVIRDGRDLLAQAQSGTGKTGAFTIGSLTCVDTTKNEVQVVVISPTRELADQTGNVAKLLGNFMGLRVHLATGGTPVDTDLQKLTRSSKEVPHFLVVTPGRFYDLLNRKAVNPRTVRVLIMDEADQLLDAKFKEQIQCIMSEPFVWPSSTQMVLVSATMIPAIAAIATSLLVRDPVTILREADEVSLDGIRQFYVGVANDSEKLGTLCDLSDSLKIEQATIFVNTQANAEKLAEGMRRRGFDLDCLHGGMDVAERKRRMEAFRAGRTRVLITTDLLARGIDVQQISLVINYELPISRENYIHRIGRSGRFGRKGASINLVEPREMRIQAEIEEFYGKTVAPLPEDLDIY